MKDYLWKNKILPDGHLEINFGVITLNEDISFLTYFIIPIPISYANTVHFTTLYYQCIYFIYKYSIRYIDTTEEISY